MVLAMLLVSTAGVVTRQLDSAQDFEVTFWRSAFAVPALLLILRVTRGRGALARVEWGQRALWLSGLCWSIMLTAFMLALTLTGVARVLITIAISPLLTAIIARWVTGRSLPLRTWLAIAVAGAGMVWMFAGQIGASADMRDWIGSVVALAVPASAAVNWTVMQRNQTVGKPLDLMPAVLIGATVSALVTAPLMLPIAASTQDLLWLALLGVLQVAVPDALVVLSARVLPAAEISLLGLLEIIFGIALVWAIAGEEPHPEVFLGGALVVGALAFNEWRNWMVERERVRRASEHVRVSEHARTQRSSE